MHLFVVVAVFALIALAGYLYSRNKRKVTAAVGGVTAFAKIADAATKAKEAEGKIIAVKAAARMKQDAASALKEAALDAHQGLDKAHKDLDEVHAILG